MQHHGSKNNVDSDFVDTVIARDYVFCGNGEHENPRPRGRRDDGPAPAGREPAPFKFWFNSSAAVSAEPDHMAEIEKIVKAQAKKSSGRFTFKFLTSGSTMTIL